MKKHLFSLRALVWLLLILLIVSAVINIYMVNYASNVLSQRTFLEKCNLDSVNTNYKLLSPDVVWLNADAFQQRQISLTNSYTPLKNSLIMVLDNARGNYSLYFEDLTSGASIEINTQEEFTPLSLLKVPTLIATLKEVESGRISIHDKVQLHAEDLDNRSGTLWEKGSGYEITVKDLLIELIKHSDNTAVLTLNRRIISDETYIESRLAMGLPAPALDEKGLSTKTYANMLRGLYFSNYLRKPFSELALTLMLETDFNSQIPAGVPKNIQVAHKVGVYELEGYFHDCGIVYSPNKPYILCIMSKNTNSQEADKVISQASKIVYTYVTKDNAYDATVTNK